MIYNYNTSFRKSRFHLGIYFNENKIYFIYLSLILILQQLIGVITPINILYMRIKKLLNDGFQCKSIVTVSNDFTRRWSIDFFLFIRSLEYRGLNLICTNEFTLWRFLIFIYLYFWLSGTFITSKNDDTLGRHFLLPKNVKETLVMNINCGRGISGGFTHLLPEGYLNLARVF